MSLLEEAGLLKADLAEVDGLLSKAPDDDRIAQRSPATRREALLDELTKLSEDIGGYEELKTEPKGGDE